MKKAPPRAILPSVLMVWLSYSATFSFTFMRSLQLVLVTASLVLLGCAAPRKFEYVKQGATKFDTENAVSECQYQVRLNKTPKAEQGELMNLCMQGKGYRYKRV